MQTTQSIHATNLWQRYALLVIAMLIVALSPAYAQQPTSGISFAQVSFTDQEAPESYSHYGQVFIDYTMLYGDGYINVERYDGGKASGWVLQNIPVSSGSLLREVSTMFDLGASGYQSSLAAYIDFSPTELADDSSLKDKVPLTYQMAQALYPLPSPGMSKATNPTPRGIVKLSPAQGPVGTRVTVTISKYPANSTIKVYFNSKQVTTITTDGDGKGTGMFTVPEGLGRIEYQVDAKGGQPLTFGNAMFVVTR